MKKLLILSILFLGLAGCVYAKTTVKTYVLPKVTPLPTQVDATVTPLPVPTAMAVAVATVAPAATENGLASVPAFGHIVLIVLENQYLQDVLGSASMPHFNTLIQQNVLLSNYFAVSHPSLPNYMALISGSTQNIGSDCLDCFVDQPNLADQIEASGRTWKGYFENMPSPCFVGNKKPYEQIFNPFIYFDSIRTQKTRCDQSVVPLTQLELDLATSQLPDFSFIMPNTCNSGHDCSSRASDDWLNSMISQLQAYPQLGENSLIIVTFDEGVEQNVDTSTRGQLATVLISPLAQPGLNDATIYTHYSLLKTIEASWNLPYLGEAQQAGTPLILKPWSIQAGLNTSINVSVTP